MKKIIFYAVLSIITFLTFIGLLVPATMVGFVFICAIEIMCELMGMFFVSDFEYQGFGFEISWIMTRIVAALLAIAATSACYICGEYPAWVKENIVNYEQ